MKLVFSIVLAVGLVTFLEATSTGPAAFERLHREPPIRGDPTKSDGGPRAPVLTKWIMQKVDNFDPQNPSTWSMVSSFEGLLRPH